jgi:hypothetical protein
VADPRTDTRIPETEMTVDSSLSRSEVPQWDLDLADAYLRQARRAKTRRLAGLIVLCALLLGVLLLILGKGWYSSTGGGGAGWVWAGVAVAVAAIGAVVVDILYRKEL